MDIIETIRNAIKERKPIVFEYNDGLIGKRIGNPHIIFMRTLKSGKTSMYLHIWQTDGVSHSDIPNWKQPLIDKISSVSILEDKSPFPIANGYNEEYDRYEVVIEKVVA